MTVLDRISGFADDLVAWRHDFHAHPEIGFEEERTAAIVAEKLASWGIEVHRGVGRTGVVGVLEGQAATIAASGFAPTWTRCRSRRRPGFPTPRPTPGKMHACGHDGHTAMLLGAARYLAETRDFDGTAVFIFQPAEEGLRRRPRDARGRAVRALPLRRGLRHAQLAGRAARQGHDAGRRRDGGGGLLRHPHQGPRRARRAPGPVARPGRHRHDARPGAADDRQRATSTR